MFTFNNCDPAVYVGTYAKYNNGSIQGKWMRLEDYEDFDSFVDACRELHKDEEDPEFMCQDYEGLPKNKYCESGLEWIREFYELADDYTDSEIEMILEYWDEVGDYRDPKDILDDYYCESMDDYDFGYMIAHETGDIPDWLECYVDYEKMGKEYKWDFTETSNYIFWNR